MTKRRFLLVSGDFVRTGGMDRANFAMAEHLARRGDEVHLVAHRVAPELLGRPNVSWRRVPKPLGSYLLGEPLLDRAGRHRASEVSRRGGRVVVNGGNCQWGDVNWVHYVHAVWRPREPGSPARRLKAAWADHRARGAERAALQRARLVLANSERTAAEVIDRLGVAPERVRVVYLGSDPVRFRPPDPAERAESRASLGWKDDRPALAFIGALGNLRKGFDHVFEAWKILASEPSWDARLAVVGAGATLPFWKDRAAEAGVAIEFLGFRDDVPRVLGACDGLVSPTRYEAYGLNVQEALCCGLPALTSAASGVAERYPDGLADWLIPDPSDAADLATRLRSWREEIGRPRPELTMLSEQLRSYTWDHMAATIAALIEPPT